METFNAEIKREEQKTTLVLKGKNEDYELILTEDSPNSIKSVFNKLLQELKKGAFSFELIDEKQDLYHQISKEYLIQLNSELLSVYEELKDYELLSE
jgi:hypothetical protein